MAQMDGVISTAGGNRCQGLSPELMPNACTVVFCTGEMLDWKALKGPYLITAAMATGVEAGAQAAQYAPYR